MFAWLYITKYNTTFSESKWLDVLGRMVMSGKTRHGAADPAKLVTKRKGNRKKGTGARKKTAVAPRCMYSVQAHHSRLQANKLVRTRRTSSAPQKPHTTVARTIKTAPTLYSSNTLLAAYLSSIESNHSNRETNIHNIRAVRGQ